MTKMNIQKAIFYVVILIYIVITQLFIPSDYYKIYNMIINPISWFIFFLVAFIILKGSNNHYRFKNNEIQTIVIIMLIYSMLYFSLGLFFSYQRNPYNTSMIGILKNLWSYGMIVVFQEYIRSAFITSKTKKVSIYILTIILFVMLDINFSSLPQNFVSTELSFKFLVAVLYESIVKNILMCYLVNKAGFLASLLYRIPFVIMTLFLSILPNINWFLDAILVTILSFIIFSCINYVELKNERGMSKKEYHKTNPMHYAPLLTAIVIMVGFIVGWFKYYPVAIMSNSMFDVIARGDVVIVERLNSEEVKNIKTGDVIEYVLDKSLIIHRVIQIQKENDNLIFTTKGDNNDAPDSFKVKENQVVGLIKFKISYIGFPSVWLNETHNHKKPNVET